MAFYAFDLLYLGGYDLTNVPLVDRKTLLAGCLDDLPAGGAIRYSEHIESRRPGHAAERLPPWLEGIISKRKDQPYRSGRVKDWFKTKCTERQEFVIAGYVPSTTSSKMVGSLVMAVYDKGRLVHVGRVGTGFKDAVARSLRDQLESLKRIRASLSSCRRSPLSFRRLACSISPFTPPSPDISSTGICRIATPTPWS